MAPLQGPERKIPVASEGPVDSDTGEKPTLTKRLAYSLHGESAARRQAASELLFFASVGDRARCQAICNIWGLQLTDATVCDYDKRTPLHLAAAEGCYSVVQWLLEAKAEPNPVDRFQHTPLEDAVRGDHGEVAQLLTSHGGRVSDRQGNLVELAKSSLHRYVRMFSGGGPGEQGFGNPEWEIDPRDLKLADKVGQGEFGTVYRARWHGSTVAVKVLRRSDEVALGDFRTELNVLQKVHHPHTTQFLGACTQRQPYMIVTEYMPGGSLADVFREATSEPSSFPSMRRAVSMALDCARGMMYLHARSKHVVIHRDLKPANLMLGGIPHETGTRKMALRIGVVKIADFGLAKSLAIASTKTHSTADLQALQNAESAKYNTPAYVMTGETGSYRYMAPEIFKHEQYNHKVDVYAFSMILFELLEGWQPYYSVPPIEAARRAALERRRPVWGTLNRFGDRIPAGLRRLVEDCWAHDFETRPDFCEVTQRLEAERAKLGRERAKGTCFGCGSVQEDG